MRCETCDTEAGIEWREGVEVIVGTVAGSLDRRPVLVCPEGHTQLFAAPPAAAATAVEQQLLQAQRRWRRLDACAHCREQLDLPVRRTRRSITVSDPALGVHTLHLDVPMTRCGGCGADQLPTRSHTDLRAVLAAAYVGPEAATDP